MSDADEVADAPVPVPSPRALGPEIDEIDVEREADVEVIDVGAQEELQGDPDQGMKGLAFQWKDVVVVQDGGDWTGRVLGLVNGKGEMFTVDFGDDIGHYDYYGHEMRLAREEEVQRCAIPIAEPKPPVKMIPDRSGAFPGKGEEGQEGASPAPAAAAENARPPPVAAAVNREVRHRLPKDKVALLLKKREAAAQLQLKAALLAPSPHCRWCVDLTACVLFAFACTRTPR